MSGSKYVADLSALSAALLTSNVLGRHESLFGAADALRSSRALGGLDKVSALVAANGAAFEHLGAIGKAAAMFREQQHFADQFERFSKTASLFDDALAGAKWMSDVEKAARTMASPYPQFLKGLDQEFARWRGLLDGPTALMGSAQSALAQAGLTWGGGMSLVLDGLASSSILQVSELAAARLLRPAVVYTDFVKATKRRIRTVEKGRSTDGSKTVRRLEVSLRFTEGQFLDAAGLLAAMLTEGSEADSAPSPERPLIGPKRQQAEFLKAAGDDDVATVAAQSTAAGIAATAREVLRIIARCNELRSVAGLDVVFTPTTRVLEVFADFPWLVAVDRSSFGDVLDCLYFLLYEGAGKDNLRFTKKTGGPLEDSDCAVIWRIKHLRNKWLRHDVEHGAAGAIRKSYEQLAGHLKALGLDGPPRTAQQFLTLQRALLAETLSFLQTLQGRLEASSGASG